MKNFKKMFVCLLAMMLMMTALTACGKSEEERAYDEIRSHMQQEAAEDGVDLEAVMESEYMASQERVEQFNQEQAAKQDFQAQVEVLIPDLSAAYNRYTTATSGSEILAAAEEFNALYADCMALAGDDAQKRLATTTINQNIGRNNSIKECIYRGKAALADANISADYTEVFFYFNTSNNDSKFVCYKYNETYELEVLVLSQNGSVYIPDLSGIKALNPSTYSAAAVTESSLIMEVVANADWLKYEFSLDDPTSTGVQIPFEQPQSEYTVWQIWGANLDEFNAIEARQSR